MKISKKTIIRTVLLIVALVNMALNAFGKNTFAFTGKRRVHIYLEAIYRRRTKEQSIHGQQDLMHRALGFIDKEYERL